MCRHIYDWNIVNCDVKQQIQLNSTNLTREKEAVIDSRAVYLQLHVQRISGVCGFFPDLFQQCFPILMRLNAKNQPKSTAQLGYMCPRGLSGPPAVTLNLDRDFWPTYLQYLTTLILTITFELFQRGLSKKVTHNFDWFYPMCVYVNYV